MGDQGGAGAGREDAGEDGVVAGLGDEDLPHEAPQRCHFHKVTTSENNTAVITIKQNVYIISKKKHKKVTPKNVMPANGIIALLAQFFTYK